MTTSSTSPVLEAKGLTAGYGELAAVRDVDLALYPGEVLALFGPNGAGKSTTILTLAGALPLIGGEVHWLGTPTRASLHQRAREGLVLVPEGRSVLASMTVRDNLLLGRGGVAGALGLFPELKPLLRRRAGLLSGGEQQMLTVARALASDPNVLLLDELSLGLAPIIVDRLLARLVEIAKQRDVGVLLVEQQARRALSAADRWLLMRNGRIAAEGDATSGVEDLERAYLASAE